MFSIPQILSLLEGAYGTRRQPRRRKTPLDVLILTVLSQNTSDTNSHKAFKLLRSRFSNWREIHKASAMEIEATIKAGGLGRIKAERIKMIMEKIVNERGELDLGFLSSLPMEQARDWLLHLPGVGPKTAACVLLFSLGEPALPVDTHIYRVTRRLGLISSRMSAEKAHDILGTMVPAEDVYRFHVLIIEHGRRLCRAQRPLCSRCPLWFGCPYGTSYIAKQKEA